MSTQPSKKARKAIDLDTKMMVIKQYEGGKKVNVIARDLKLSHSTVSTILKDKERIREAVKASVPMQSTVITKQRTGPIHEMEKLLHIWIEDQIQKQTSLSIFSVQTKARSLFETLKESAGEDYSQEFVASTGWFKRFKKRFQLNNVRMTGEAGSADEEAAFPELMPTNADEAASIAESNLSNMMQHLPSTLLNQNCLDDKCDTPIDPLTTDTKISGPQLVKKSHCSTILEQLMSDDTYTDVTLTAQGQCLHAHKVVLCLSSSYFREVLGSSFSSSIVAFRDVTFKELKNVINFIYAGEIEIDASELESFMKTAEMLQIAAFCENQRSSSIDSSNVKSKGRNSTKTSNKRMRENSDVVNAKKQFYEDSIASENEIFSIPFIKTEIVTEDVPMEGEEFYEEQENISGTSDSSKNIYGTTFKPTARRTGQPISNCSLKKEKNTQKLNQSLQKDSATEDLQCSTNLLDNLNYQIDQDNPIDQDQYAGKQVVTQTEPTEGNPVLPPGRCPYCSESSDPVSGASLQDHLLTSHSHKPAFICQSCQRVFTVYKQYEEHVRGCGKKI